VLWWEAARCALWPVRPEEIGQPIPGLGLVVTYDGVSQQGLRLPGRGSGQHLSLVPKLQTAKQEELQRGHGTSPARER